VPRKLPLKGPLNAIYFLSNPYSIFSLPHRNITFLSLVVLEKSMWAGCSSTGANESSSELLIQRQELEERTHETLDVNAFEGIRTPCHQCHDPLKLFLPTPL